MPGKASKTDFSILMTDFNRAVHETQMELNELVPLEGHMQELDEGKMAKIDDTARRLIEVSRQLMLQDFALTELFHAADSGNIQTLRQAFNQGVDVDLLNKGGHSLLAYASAGGRTRTVDFLIQRHANVNLRGAHAFSPIEFAVIKDNCDVFNRLVKAGAVVEQETLRQIAQQNNSFAVLKLL